MGWVKRLRRRVQSTVLRIWAGRQGLGGGRPHGLPGRLVVSLTSYPPRFPTLSLTLRCLLSQSVTPDLVLLWIARADIAQLPREVLALERHGLRVMACEDTGPYKKIIPALLSHPAAYIATADDDQFYPRDWLASLVDGQVAEPGKIICHTARVISFDEHGNIGPYILWPLAIAAEAGPLLPTGYGGVLYPPGSLPAETTDVATFAELAPTADDLWLRWMSGRHGTDVHLVTRGRPWVEWHGSLDGSLVRTNIEDGGNDRQIGRLVERYGSQMFRS